MERKVKFAAGEMESFQSCSRPVAPRNRIRGGGERRRWRRGGGSLGSEGKQNSETRKGPGGLRGRKGCCEDDEDDINMRPFPRVSMRLQLMLHTQGFIIQ